MGYYDLPDVIANLLAATETRDPHTLTQACLRAEMCIRTHLGAMHPKDLDELEDARWRAMEAGVTSCKKALRSLGEIIRAMRSVPQ